VRREELGVAGLAALGVLTWGTMAGVAIGVALSYLLVLRLLGKPSISVLAPPDGRWTPLSSPLPQRRRGMAVVRVDLPVYWASARRVVEQLVSAVDAAPDPPRVLVLDWSDQPRPGSSLLAAGADLNQQLRQRNVALWIVSGRTWARDPSQDEDRVRRFASLDDALAAHRDIIPGG